MRTRQTLLWIGMLFVVAIGLLAWKQQQPPQKYMVSLNRDGKQKRGWLTVQPPMPPEGWLHIVSNDYQTSDIYSPDLRTHLSIEKLQEE